MLKTDSFSFSLFFPSFHLIIFTQNIEEFLNFCIHVIVDNSLTNEKNKVLVIEKTDKYGMSMRKIVKKNSRLQVISMLP